MGKCGETGERRAPSDQLCSGRASPALHHLGACLFTWVHCSNLGIQVWGTVGGLLRSCVDFFPPSPQLNVVNEGRTV